MPYEAHRLRVLNESFEGYIVLENKLNSVNLDGLFVYNNTLLPSSYPDNTLETSRKLTKQGQIKVVGNKSEYLIESIPCNSTDSKDDSDL